MEIYKSTSELKMLQLECYVDLPVRLMGIRRDTIITGRENIILRCVEGGRGTRGWQFDNNKTFGEFDEVFKTAPTNSIFYRSKYRLEGSFE